MTMLLEAGVDVLLHTYVVQTLTEGPAVTGVIVENKAGRAAILARVVVDATGDGDVAASAGAAFVQEEEPLPVTLMANLGGVDSARAIAALGNWGNLRGLIDEAVASGELDFELEVHSRYFAPGVFAADLCHPGEVNLWPGSMFGVNGLDPRQLTRAEIVTRDHTLRLVDFLRRKAAGIRAGMAGVHGQPARRARDAADRRRLLADPARGAFGSVRGRHRQALRKAAHAHPLRSLVPEALDGLLVAGRCMSAEQDAMVQLRLIPVCLATGQAAGTAAAMAAGGGVNPRDLDIADLQADLVGQGADLGLEAAADARRG